MSIRIQFDFTDEEWERVSRYISHKKVRHVIGKDAFLEWCTRKEGRDKKLIKERLIADMKLILPIIQELIDTNQLKINR